MFVSRPFPLPISPRSCPHHRFLRLAAPPHRSPATLARPWNRAVIADAMIYFYTRLNSVCPRRRLVVVVCAVRSQSRVFAPAPSVHHERVRHPGQRTVVPSLFPFSFFFFLKNVSRRSVFAVFRRSTAMAHFRKPKKDHNKPFVLVRKVSTPTFSLIFTLTFLRAFHVRVSVFSVRSGSGKYVPLVRSDKRYSFPNVFVFVRSFVRLF